MRPASGEQAMRRLTRRSFAALVGSIVATWRRARAPRIRPSVLVYMPYVPLIRVRIGER